MQRLLPTTILAFALFPAMAQQVLFTEDFEGAQPNFTLNTTDVGSTASGANTWLVNNAYTGGSGTIACSGLDIPFNVANTAAQPAAISTPNGHYMHITSTAAMASDVLNCCFAAADGFCTPAGNYFAGMSSDVSTVGSAEATFSFWWLCAGSNNCYGQVYYCTDGGTTWTQITEPLLKYRSQPTWTSQSITMAEFGEQATLRFGFRFVNGTTLNANDPAFGIDDVAISATTVATAIVTTPFSSATDLDAVRWLGQQGGIHRFDVGTLSLEGVEIFEATGRKMTVRTRSGNGSLTIDLGEAAPGVYLVRFRAGGRTAVLRLVNGE